MALSVSAPSFAFTSQFPNIVVSGTAGATLEVYLKLGDSDVLVGELYTFNSSGFVTMRNLGDILEKHFYDYQYEVRNFVLQAVFTFKSGIENVTKNIQVFFLRSYVSTDNITPEAIRNMALTREKEKHTLPEVDEYISFISTSGSSVMAKIIYQSGSNVLNKTITLHTFVTTDIFTTVDVSAAEISAHLSANEKLLAWDVYKSGYPSSGCRWILDKKSSFPPTSFVYQNCFGAIESFLCRGILKDEFNSERTIASFGNQSFLAEMKAMRSYTVNTGFLDPDQKESLIDLLSSRNLMLISGEKAISIIVDGQNVSMHNFRSKLPNAEFSFSHAIRNLTVATFNESEGVFDYTFDQTFN